MPRGEGVGGSRAAPPGFLQLVVGSSEPWGVFQERRVGNVPEGQEAS